MPISDFGEKIGGAKKDIWKARGLMVSDLLSMNTAEKDKFIKKDNIWKKPDYMALVSDGIPVRVVYFMKLMRDSLPTKPVLSYLDKTPEQQKAKQEGYINFVTNMRDAVMSLKTETDVKQFYKTFLDSYIIKKPYSSYVTLKPEAFDCITNKTLRHAHYAETSFYYIDKDIKNKKFCYSDDEKLLSAYSFHPYRKSSVTFTKDYQGRDVMEIAVPCGMLFLYPDKKDKDPSSWMDDTYFVLRGRNIVGRNYASLEAAKNAVLSAEKAASKEKDDQNLSTSATTRKKKFVPKQLLHIVRIGDDYRKGKSVTGRDYLDVFSFKGGEFGNWMSEKDRQSSLDYGFDALLDLCAALKMDPKDISLGNKLSIAFGARGSGSALAHYEPLREVINLTKMRGAGSLAHEWGHALDDIIGKSLGISGFMTEKAHRKDVPESLKTLMDAMKYKFVYDEDVQKAHQKQVRQAELNARRYAEAFFSSNLSDMQKNTRDHLIDTLLNDAPNSGDKLTALTMYGDGYPEIDAISDYRKTLTGRVIPKAQRLELARYVNHLQYCLGKTDKPKRVETDFYKQSKQFDSEHSKTDNGYWQSSVELFARAFACYVTDKIAECDHRSDYLSGHSDAAVSIVFDASGNTTTIRAFPHGEERKQINKAFDGFIKELKELGYIHHKEVAPDFFRKPTQKNIQKPSLDCLINSARAEQTNSKAENASISTRERKDGQLEFELW